MFTDPRRFYRSIQSQQVGLESDFINHANDVRNFLTGGIDCPHRADGFTNHFSASGSFFRRIGRK
ncbi:Uncharacterised protein [Vibrio cholerae]|nr:Uncharacterised protein [Vibrio cholerae]